MKHNFPYLRDTAFLAKLDRIKVREEYVKIMQNNIDIISIIWQNIVLEIPLRVVSEDIDDSLTSGDGWKLIREE